jgi:hypothetical protein
MKRDRKKQYSSGVGPVATAWRIALADVAHSGKKGLTYYIA